MNGDGTQIKGVPSNASMMQPPKAMTAEDYLLDMNAQQINGAADNGMQIPLDALMSAVMMARAELLQDGLQGLVNEISSKNNELKELNEVMAKTRRAKRGSGDGSKKTAIPQEIKDYFWDKGIPGVDGDDLNSAEWDLAIENLKGRSESLTSTSQLQMTKLQSLTGKHNQTYEMLSQFVSKYLRNTESLIKNI